MQAIANLPDAAANVKLAAAEGLTTRTMELSKVYDLDGSTVLDPAQWINKKAE